MKNKLLILIIFLFGQSFISCQKPKQATPKIENIEEPRTVSVTLWDGAEDQSMGFDMGATWSNTQSEVSLEQIVGNVSVDVSKDKKKKIIEHLFSLFDDFSLSEFKVDRLAPREEEYFYFIGFDSDVFEFEIYKVPYANEGIHVWVKQFKELYKNCNMANKIR